MELKPGYKQTEVGIIPEDWNVETISNLIEEQAIIGHLDGNHGELYPRSHEFKQYGVPYVGANDFSEGLVKFEDCKFLSHKRALQFKKGIAKDGDVLFAHNATVGPVALLRTNEPFVILSTTATYFRCNSEKLNNLYLKAALQAGQFVRQYQSVMAQSTRFQVPITTQRKLRLTIPPLSEQRSIATALSDMDELLGGLDRLITKKRDLKQSAMQQLLTGKKRLTGFSEGDNYKQTEVGIIPETWEIQTLGKVSTISRLAGAEYTSFWTETVNGEIIALRGFNIGKGKIIERDLVHISNKLSLKLKRSRLCKGDVVYPCVGSIGNAVAITEDCKYHIQQNIARITPKQCVINSCYLVNFLMSTLAAKEVERFTSSSSQPSILVGSLREYRISLPPLPEQTAIASILSDMDTEIATLEQRRNKTRDLKQAMMQELLTGRIRLL